jgi:hypothetical protein
VTAASPDDPEEELLGLLADEFDAGGIPCRVLPAIDAVPAQLMVPLEGESATTVVHVCFLPDHDQPPVLQYLVALTDDVATGVEADAARFVQTVNAALPLTGFEVSETAQAVVFRYIQPVSVHPLDPAVIAWPLSMINYAVTYFGPLITAVCQGTPLADANAAFAAAQEQLFGDTG